jgi:hypothetical protein
MLLINYQNSAFVGLLYILGKTYAEAGQGTGETHITRITI